jgi:hypothetical protein
MAVRLPAAVLLLGVSLLLTASSPPATSEALEGRAPTAEELRPAVQAAFARESYAPGDRARLVLFGRERRLSLQVFHIGPEHTPTVGNSELQGVPMGRSGEVAGRGRVSVRVGSWPSGLYFARLQAQDGRIGFAPFVVRPRRLGEHRIAVVLPTMTWQAYNLRDDDGDGRGDSWYADWNHHTVRLARPYLNRGVPYNFRSYDLPFLHWLAWTGKQVDFLADSDLDALQGARALARAYALIVFPGHHEYVTTREYDVVTGYRDLGGNLAFLSANDFFWQVVRNGDVIERTRQWRDLGRPEAGLIGVQYRGNDRGQHRAPWVIRDAEAARWLFAGTGLADGSRLGSGGIEIDKTAAASPHGVKVLAEIPNLFGPGFTAQMTYYRAKSGARVFAAGAFTLAGAVESDPLVARMMENLWQTLGGGAADPNHAILIENPRTSFSEP